MMTLREQGKMGFDAWRAVGEHIWQVDRPREVVPSLPSCKAPLVDVVAEHAV